MVTIEKDLPQLALAGNPVLLKVISDNIIEDAGTHASMLLKIQTPDATAGHFFTISYGDIDLAFVSSASPDDSGLQYPAASGDTFSTWAEKIADALAANYLLSTLYDIELLDAEASFRAILLTAKNYGSDYTLSFAAGTATGITQDQNTAGEDFSYRTNFGIVASVWNGLVKEAEDIRPVGTDGRTTFNLSDYLMSLIDGSGRFTWPEIDGTNVYERSDMMLSYRVSLAEKYDGTVRKLSYGDTKYAIAGGLSTETLMRLGEDGDEFFDVAANQQKFLTWAPVEREAGEDNHLKLFFLFHDPSTYTQYRMAVVVTFANGTMQKIYGSSLTSITPYRIIEMACGYEHLGLALLDPTTTVKRWHVFLENEAGIQISESRIFLFDEDVYENQRQFIFRNSFGCYDVVRFTGQCDTGIEYDRAGGNLVVTEEVTAFNAPGRTFSVNESQRMKTSSGWLSRAGKMHLRDMMRSDEVYEIIDGKLYPVTITSTKAQSFVSDSVTLYSIDLEYDRSYTDRFWSELPAAAEGTVTDRVYSDDYNPIEYS